MKIVAFSDVHGALQDIPKIPPCDVLIFAGDYSGQSSTFASIQFNSWLNQQKQCRNIIVVPGNHDTDVGFISEEFLLLNDEREIDGVKFFGCSYTPEFNNWFFMQTEDNLKKMFAKFPQSDIDVLVTRGPPRGRLDYVRSKYGGEEIGSTSLRDYVDILKPKLHIFGHNHQCGSYHDGGPTEFFNVSLSNQYYQIQYQLTEINLCVI